MDLMSLVPALFDSSQLGLLDAAVVGAVHEGTNRAKEWMDEHFGVDRMGRIEPFLPYGVAYVLAWLNEGMPLGMHDLIFGTGKMAILYGLAATQGWNIYKKTFKGE
jgi:hypothetical protein